MGDPKPIASLSGLLLARKGAARPAMRRPAFGNGGGPATNQDDLGWNDMGYDVNPDPSTPMDHDHGSRFTSLANAVPEVKPEVREQQERIAQQLQAQADVGFESVPSFTPEVEDAAPKLQEFVATPVSEEPVYAALVVTPPAKTSVAAKPSKRAAPGSKGKAAFTLRLDAERHLKLRLACAVSNRSAQMLVTDALDALLDAMPEIGQLAARLPVNK
jgi:hypothetical protein